MGYDAGIEADPPILTLRLGERPAGSFGLAGAEVVVEGLTVAIPTCNGARHLAVAIRGILAQEGVAFDLLVCDDRSDDATPEVVRAEAGDRARVEVNPERLGLAGNWNRCMALSRTPLVAIFHQDDVMHPGHLAAYAAALSADPARGLACGEADAIDDAGRPLPPSEIERGALGPADLVFPPGAFLAHLADRNPVRCSAAMIRAAAHADVGGFDPSYRYVVDWEFWIRLARRWSVAWLARPTVSVRWHPASETQRFRTGTGDLDEAARLLVSFYASDPPPIPDAPRRRRAAVRHLALAYLDRARVALDSGSKPLARRCLAGALRAWPGIVASIVHDPRLAATIASLILSPGLSGRQLGRKQGETGGAE